MNFSSGTNKEFDWEDHFRSAKFNGEKVLPSTIRVGSTGPDVVKWQQIIGTDADGKFGPNTQAKTIEWQTQHKLVADGIVGPATWQAALGDPAAPIISDIPAGEMPNKITVITPELAAQALSDGYKQVTGSKPTKEILALLVGQSALETGNWKAIHNYNFGNFKAAPGDRNYQYFRCSEIINGQEVFFDPPDPACKFAAYLTADQGAAAYVKGLKNRSNWWNGLQTGTVSGFIDGLTTAPKYFTASPSLYKNVLTDRYNTYLPLAVKYAGIGVMAMFAWLGTGLATIAGLWYYSSRK